MLIGPTITLAELESHMDEKINGSKMELNKLAKEYAKLQQELHVTPKMITDENTGDQIVNPRYLKIIEEAKDLQTSIEDLNNQNEFMAHRVAELESIEDRSYGKVDKSKSKITLTLNDCIMLDIDLSGEDAK